MHEEEVREWLRENLTIEAHPDGDQNSVIVGLRFKEEDYPFVKVRIYIPEDAQ